MSYEETIVKRQLLFVLVSEEAKYIPVSKLIAKWQGLLIPG